MGEKGIVLSISLLVSGREETKKCLDSIKPLLEAVPSELILVDTGCNEEKKRLISQYTDKIVEFKWCNDFAKARNVGLKQATGEWFMFMDDDEWFEDVEPVIEFFKSKEYIKYCSAYYYVRNYDDISGQSYSDFAALRMVKRTNQTSFVGTIHEHLTPCVDPSKVIDSFVHHYGYVFTSRDEKLKHIRRNLSLLLEGIDNEPYNLHYYEQIVQEYHRIPEYSKMIETCLKGIEICHKLYKKRGLKVKSRELGNLYGYICKSYYCLSDSDKEEEFIKKAFAEKSLTDMAKAYIADNACTLYYEAERYGKVMEYFEYYMKIYNEIGKDKNKLVEQGGLIVCNTFEKIEFRDVIYKGIMASLKLGKKDILEEYFDLIDWKDGSIQVHPHFYKIVIEFMSESEFDEYYLNIAQTICDREDGVDAVVSLIMELEKKDGEQEKFKKLIPIFSKVEHAHWYITYLKILDTQGSSDEEEAMPELFNKLFKHTFDVLNLDKAIWKLIDKYQIDVEPYLLRIAFPVWVSGIDRWMANTDLEDVEYKEAVIRRNQKQSDIRYDYLYMKIAEAYLTYYEEEKADYNWMKQKLFSYGKTVKNYYGKLYKEEAFDEYSEALPEDCLLGWKLVELEHVQKEQGFLEALRFLKDIIEIYQPLIPVLKLYSKQLAACEKEKLKQEEEQQMEQPEYQEMQMISQQLKLQVKEMLSNHDIENARNVLKQLLTITPEDGEAKELLEQAEMSNTCYVWYDNI